jgi:hypothetical protein
MADGWRGVVAKGIKENTLATAFWFCTGARKRVIGGGLKTAGTTARSKPPACAEKKIGSAISGSGASKGNRLKHAAVLGMLAQPARAESCSIVL